MIRVLLADDQALVRGGFRLILDAEPDIEVVAEAADGDQAVASALETRPDLVLMDIRMPVLDGIEATRQLVPQLGTTRVVILTTFDLDDYVVDAFRAGASGFLLKTAPPAQLVAAVRTVHSGDALLAPSSTRRLIEQFARPPAPVPELERADGPRTRRAAPARARPDQRGDRRAARRRAVDHQVTRRQPAGQARPARPGPGGGVRLRKRPRPPRRDLAARTVPFHKGGPPNDPIGRHHLRPPAMGHFLVRAMSIMYLGVSRPSDTVFSRSDR